MVREGYDSERIIDELLKLYFRYRNFKVDYLDNSEITIGFIGYRGTGKSASIAKIVIEDFLLAGKRAWSNMPISVKVKYRDAEKVFSTEPLPKLKLLEGDVQFQNGVAVLDEVNMEVGEATRYMSNTNLDFANRMQQIRKTGMNVIWSAQNWNTVDARLRWQSDYIVLCSLKKPEHRGLFSYWRVIDSTGMSGKLDFDVEMKSHYLLDKVVQEGTTFIRPFWKAYDTRKLQGQGAYNKKDLQKAENIGRVNEKENRFVPEDDALEYAESQLSDTPVGGKIVKKHVWDAKGWTKDNFRKYGKIFAALGCVSHGTRKGSYWEKTCELELVVK